MNKKGFTLIEVIVCLALLGIVGVGITVSVITINNKKTNNVLLENSEVFETALNIYLSSHGEILNNLYNSVEGAIISLELLKNEGLIDDDLAIDYKENFFLLSDAVLLKDETNLNDECNGRVSIKTIKSWDLSKYDSSNVLYICPNNNSGGNISSVITNGYIARGKNPNNWVKFDVIPNNNDWVWFPNDDDQNLWRIVNIDDNGKIKLIYNKQIKTNNANNPNYDKTNCQVYEGVNYCRYLEDGNYNPDGYYNKNGYYNMVKEGLNLYSIFETESNESFKNSAKYFLYNSIVNKSWIEESNYCAVVDTSTTPFDSFDLKYLLNSTCAESYTAKLGTISLKELKQSLDYDETYLSTMISSKIIISFAGTMSSSICFRLDYDSTLDYDSGSSCYFALRAKEYLRYFIEYGEDYLPVITLNSNIKIKNYNNCSDGSVRGSKNCPFELIEK